MKKAILIFGCGLLTNLAFAQITNESLLEMKRAGLSDEIIKTKIVAEDSKFDVSTNGIIELKKNGFSDEIISLMIYKNNAVKENVEVATNQDSGIIHSIENKHNTLVINNEIVISKGGNIQVYLPSGQDFMFIKPKSKGLNAKLLGNIAGVVGTGAAAVGVGTGSIGVLDKSIKVMNTARAVQYGADAIDRIQDLPISDKAKKIAGKQMIVQDWKFTDDGWVITAELDKKKFEINLQEAVLAGEVKL